MDLVALALAKKYANSRIANFGGADWAQNVSGAKDYVKNRTHYEEKAILFDGTIPEDAIFFPAIEGGCFVKIQDMPLSYDELLNKEIVVMLETNEGNMESPGTLREDSLMQEDGLVIGVYNDMPVILSALTDFDLPLDENIVLSMTKGLYFFAADMGVQKMYLSRLGKDGVKQLDAKYIPELPYQKEEKYKLIAEEEKLEGSTINSLSPGNGHLALKKAIAIIDIPAYTGSIVIDIWKQKKVFEITPTYQSGCYIKVFCENLGGIANISYTEHAKNSYTTGYKHYELAGYLEGENPFSAFYIGAKAETTLPIGTKVTVWGVEA